MSDYDFITPRTRKKHLFVVEGKDEKNSLFKLLFQCFPEVDVRIEDILVYGTNIYQLYQDIVDVYGPNWSKDDIDLPYVVGKKQEPPLTLSKRDFANIFLIFDYERHDFLFTEEKILAMQKYFDDVAGNGQLYLNYPMLEACQHLLQIPDPDYESRYAPANMKAGHNYKNITKGTYIAKILRFPDYLDRQLKTKFGVTNDSLRKECIQNILLINNCAMLFEQVGQCLSGILDQKKLCTATHCITHWVCKMGYAHSEQTFYQYARNIMCQVILHNIKKASKIQTGVYHVTNIDLYDVFHGLSFETILETQNSVSRNPDTGFIWVLCTCILFIPDYNFKLLDL